ncbi:MAG: hypothetical protein WCV90_08170 [Candidatus Woesearchaeota archaeon]|jgi:hypothetical protein
MDKVYYIEDYFMSGIISFLKGQGFAKINFVPLNIPSDPREAFGKKVNFAIEEESAVLIWGDGSFHQASYYFSPSQPYCKSVDDAHHDFKECYESISCASHNLALIRNDPLLQELELLGVTEEDSQLNSSSKVRICSSLGSNFSRRLVHKSIDLDVIFGYPCSESYASGRFTFPAVMSAFEEILRNNDLSRLDLGGLSKYAKDSLIPLIHKGYGMREYRDLLTLFFDYRH